MLLADPHCPTSTELLIEIPFEAGISMFLGHDGQCKQMPWPRHMPHLPYATQCVNLRGVVGGGDGQDLLQAAAIAAVAAGFQATFPGSPK